MILLLAGAGLWAKQMGSALYYLNWGQKELDPIFQDLNNNGIDECYLLDKHTLNIIENNRELWTSPPEWQISTLLVGDANHDGQEDLLLVVWKRGSFGKDKPFWVEENDRDLRCHLFMFNLTGEQIKAVWMSSALHRPIYSLQLTDLDQDGKNELLIQEGSYSLLSRLTHSHDDTPSLWQWQSWGFRKQGIVPHRVESFTLEKEEKPVCLLFSRVID